ncbi:MAG: tetratricopeptide repeat protein, partial [Phycisphaeraceae bacterium]
PARALGYYGRALRNPSARTDLELIDKYVAALAAAPIDDPLQAERHLAQLREWMRRATELRLDDHGRLERFYHFELRIAREIGSPRAYDRLHELADSRLASAPDNIVARKFRGITQVHRLTADASDEDRRQARNDLETVRADRPDDAEVLHHLARWHLLEAQRLERAGRDPADHDEQALALSREMLEADPEDRDRRLKHLRILTHPRIAATDAARDLARDVAAQLHDDPRPVRDVLMLAEVLRNAAGMDEARELLAAAVDARPDDATLRTHFGRLLTVAGERDAAIEQLEAARQRGHSTPPLDYTRHRRARLSATTQLADLWLARADEAGDTDAREQALRRAETLIQAIEQTDTNPPALPMLRGKLALLRGEVGRAALALDEAIDRFDPPPRHALLLSAEAHRRLDNWGTAANRLRQLLERDPDDDNVRLRLAAMQLQRGQLGPAAAHIDRLLRRHPDDAGVRQLKLHLHARRGEIDDATAIYHDLPPETQRDALAVLVRACVAAGQRDRALALLDDRLQRDAGDLRALQLMVEIAPQQVRRRDLLQHARDDGANESSLELLAYRLEHGQEATANELVERLMEQQDDPLQRALLRARIALRGDDVQRLRDAIDEAAAIAPDHERVVEMRFELALHDRQWQRAARLADVAAQRNLDLAQGAFFQARLAHARGDLAEASAHYRRALSARPVYAEGWRRFGDVLAELDDRSVAIDAYRRAIEQQPDNVDARRGLARVLARRGDHAGALEQLRQAVQHAPTDRALINRYLTYEQDHGDPQRALALRQQVARTNPDDQANRRALAVQLAREGRHDQALRTVERLIDEHGRTTANVGTLAVVHRLRGAPEVGERVVIDHLEQLGEEAPAEAHLLLARYRLSLGDGRGAMQAYRQAIQREDVDQRPVTRELAALLLNRGMYAQAATLLEPLYEANPSDQTVALRYAEALLRAGRLDEAAPVVSQLDESGEALALRGLLAGRHGETDKALNLLTEVIELDGDSAAIHLERARLRLAQRDHDGALADLQQALERNAELIEARELLADVHLQRGEIEAAIAALRTVLEQMPARHEARLRLVQLHRSRDALDAAERVLEEAATLFPEDARWPRQRAALAMQRGDLEAAVQHSRRTVELEPTAAHLAQLAELQLTADQPEAVLSLLREHAGETNQQALLQALRARALVITDRIEQADRAFAHALETCGNVQQAMAVAQQLAAAYGADAAVQRIERDSPSLSDLWRGIAAATIDKQRGHGERVIQRLQRLADAAAQADRTTRWHHHYLLASALHTHGDPAAARAAYERVLDLTPEHSGTLNNLAYLLVDKLDAPIEALPLAEKAAALAPRNAAVLDTLGWAQYRAGQVEAARRTLERSLSLRPLPETALHLASVYRALGERERAQVQLELATQLAEQSNNDAVLAEARRQLEQPAPAGP